MTEMARLAQAHQVGQIITVFNHADAGVGNPDAIDAIHIHSQSIGNQNLNDDIVGTDQDRLSGVLDTNPLRGSRVPA